MSVLNRTNMVIEYTFCKLIVKMNRLLANGKLLRQARLLLSTSTTLETISHLHQKPAVDTAKKVEKITTTKQRVRRSIESELGSASSTNLERIQSRSLVLISFLTSSRWL